MTIKVFQATLIPPDANILIVGNKNTGKSTLLCRILRATGAAYGAATSPCARTCAQLETCLPAGVVQPLVGSIAAFAAARRFDEDRLFVVDGVTDELGRSPALRQLVMSRVACLLTAERLSSVPAVIRSHMDFIILTASRRDTCDKMCELYCRPQDTDTCKERMTINKILFHDLAKDCTKSYGCLVLDVRPSTLASGGDELVEFGLHWHRYTYYWPPGDETTDVECKNCDNSPGKNE